MSSGVKLLMLSLAFVVGIANGDDLSSDEEGQVPLLDQGIQLFHDVTQFATRQADLFSGNFVEEVVDRIHDTDHGVRICNEQEEFSNGVCHTQFKCNTFGGERVGFCPIITPKTTCCKFEKTCGGESDHTVAYFNSPRPNADEIPCEFKIKSRLGACQLRLDFLIFTLPSPNPFTGKCIPGQSLEIEVSGRPSIFLCGINSGTHLFLPISRIDETIRLKMPGRQVSEFSIKATQIDCRGGRSKMMARRAPDGCLQYFTEDKGALASFNFDRSSPMAPDQDYSICFKSTPDICAVALQADAFEFGVDPPEPGQGQQCARGFWGTFGAVGEDGNDLGADRFCRDSFGDENKKMVSFQKPFVFRVKTGSKNLEGSSGFLMIYNLIRC